MTKQAETPPRFGIHATYFEIFEAKKPDKMIIFFLEREDISCSQHQNHAFRLQSRTTSRI